MGAPMTLSALIARVEEGHKIGRMTLLGRHRENGISYWRCRCDCGNEKLARLADMRRGRVVSCGCYHSDITRDRSVKHGYAPRKAQSPEFKIWMGMTRRCRNAADPKFARYGGRGITVCDAWAESFENFFRDMGERPSPHHSIDRIDNDGNYEPGNCRWATASEQVRNSTKARPIKSPEGVSYGSMIEAAEATGLSWNRVRVLCEKSRRNNLTAGHWHYIDHATLRALSSLEDSKADLADATNGDRP